LFFYESAFLGSKGFPRLERIYQRSVAWKSKNLLSEASFDKEAEALKSFWFGANRQTDLSLRVSRK